MTRTNYNVEMEHWLIKLIEHPESDLLRIVEAFQLDVSQLLKDLTRTLDKLKNRQCQRVWFEPRHRNCIARSLDSGHD